MSPPRTSVEEVQQLFSSSSNRYDDDIQNFHQLAQFFFSSFRSLLDIHIAAEIAISRKRVEFAGRLCTPSGKIAKLYQVPRVNDGDNGHNPQFSP